MAFDGKPSGLRNPSRSLRSLAAMALALEALVLLLAIQPIRVLEGGITATQLVALIGGAVVAVLLTGMLDRQLGWTLIVILQGVLLFLGLQHWMIAVVGFIFGMAWAYIFYVRRKVLL